jgi:hypothetical protein
MLRRSKTPLPDDIGLCLGCSCEPITSDVRFGSKADIRVPCSQCPLYPPKADIEQFYPCLPRLLCFTAHCYSASRACAGVRHKTRRPFGLASAAPRILRNLSPPSDTPLCSAPSHPRQGRGLKTVLGRGEESGSCGRCLSLRSHLRPRAQIGDSR